MLLLAGLAVFVGCDPKNEGAPESPASASAAAAKPAPSVPPEPAAPWYVGTWRASFETEPNRVALDRKQGAPRAWTEEEPPTDGVGKVELSVTVDETGQAVGQAKGALGALAVRGTLLDETLKVRLIPQDPSAFGGTLVAEKKGEALSGELRASRGDSLALSKATVALKKDPEKK